MSTEAIDSAKQNIRNEIEALAVLLITGDLSHATVRFTHLAGRETGGDAAKALARTAGFLRSELSRRLNLYSVPQLQFVYDDSIESGIRMSQLIDEAIAADKQHPEG